MGKIRQSLKNQLKHHHFIVAGLLAGGLLMSVPLQLYMPLGRVQHYGLSLFILGLGYILQVVWSWSHLKLWPRLGYAITGLYLTSIGIIFYANPWLDTRVAIMTEEKESLKSLIGWLYSIFSLPLVYVYVRWMREDSLQDKSKGDKN